MGKQRNSSKEMTKGKLPRPWHTGLLLNQMSVDWTRFMLRQTNLAGEFHQAIARLNSMGAETVSVSQTQAGGLLELMGRSIRAKAGLLRQASSAAQAPNVPESLSRWMGFWMGAFRLACSNANAVVQINAAALTSWWRLLPNGK